MDEKVLQIVLQARDEASAVIKNASNSLSGLSSQAKLGAGIVATATLAAGAAVVAMGTYSVNAAATFQSAMTLVQTQAGASAQEVDKMSTAVLNLAGQTATAPKILADGLFYVESAGYRGAAALDILKLAAEGAKVGHADLAQTANVLTTVMSSGIGGIHNATDAMGTINATVGAGKMKMQDLVDAMSTGILPTAKAAGISMQQLGATLAVFTNNGVPAVDAASRLRMTIGLMVTPSSKAIKTLQDMGMTSTQLAKDMQSGGIVQAVSDLKDHLKGMSAVAQEQALGKMFGTREGASIMTLVDNVGQLHGRLDQINKTGGNFGSAWQKTSQDASVAFEKLRTQVEVLAIKFGTALLPYVTKVANFLANNLAPAIDNVTKFFQKHKDALALVAAVVAGVLIIGLGALVTTIGIALAAVAAFVGGWVLVAAVVGGVVAGVVALIVIHFNDIKKVLGEVGDFFKRVWNDILGILKKVGDWIVATFAPYFKAAFDFIKVVHDVLKDMFLIAWTFIKDMLDKFGKWLISTFGPYVKAVSDFIKGILDREVQGWTNIWNTITGLLSNFGKWLSSTFGPIIKVAFDFINKGLITLSDGWTKVWNGIKTFIGGIAKDISSVVKTMMNDIIGFINNIIHGANSVGSKIPGYTKLPDIRQFENGGWVPSTGLAIVHQGEFVMSNAMLQGRQSIPSQVNNRTNYSQPITIQNVNLASNMDVNELGYKLAFMLRNSR